MLLELLLLGCTTPESTAQSRHARVVPKGGAVWSRDLARGLALHPWELCKELGDVDCVGEAHLITLGGTEPEALGVDKPLENALITAPIAVDRVALSACGERYVRDQAGPVVIFDEVDTAAKRKKVGRSLVERLLSRRADTNELWALEQLYAELQPVSTDLDRDWSIGACTIVATSTEALFY